MTEHENVAFIIGSAIGALIEAMGMLSANLERHANGEANAYPDTAFLNLMKDRGLEYNSLMLQLRR